MELKKQCGEKVRVIRIHDRGNGCITTKEAYRDYRVQVEYRWTGQSYLGRSWKCHDSGFLFHSQGHDGMYHGTWKWSFEADMIQSRTPDFITVVLRGYAVPPKPFTYMATVPHFFPTVKRRLRHTAFTRPKANSRCKAKAVTAKSAVSPSCRTLLQDVYFKRKLEKANEVFDGHRCSCGFIPCCR
ncbi:MAG: DUF1080 domain-containing protein [Kiritimatiellae bacterium]|nr:DUF1080 domain-containing protein [Kiritimatiellia bacterium]